jgi:hypothetical protein
MKSNIPKIQAISAQLASEDSYRRTLEGNLQLRRAKLDHTALINKLNSLASKLADDGGTLNKVTETQREMQRADQERQKFMTERDTARGKLEIYNQQSIAINTKLGSKVYKGIDERHRKKTIEFETTEMAAKDLESYAQAL